MNFPPIELNENVNGWGPSKLPEREVNIPFAPYSKSFRFLKAADFVQKETGKHSRNYNQLKNDESAANEQFNLVDTAKTKVTRTSMRGRFQKKRNLPVRRTEPQVKQQLKGKQLKYLNQHAKRGKQWRRPKNTGRTNYRRNRQNEPSVKIQEQWEILEQFDLSSLTKMQIQPPKIVELKTTGTVYKFNDAFDKITARTSIPLDKEKFRPDVYPAPSTTDDPILVQYAREATKSSDSVASIFCTDELMAQIMVSTRSVYPWDLVFNRMDGNMVIIEKREESRIHLQTVNETAPPLPEDDEKALTTYNLPSQLAQEATKINQVFRQQVLATSAKSKVFSENNELLSYVNEEEEEDDPDSQLRAKARESLGVAYRYRKYILGNIEVYARTELHSTYKQGTKRGFGTIYAFNEWDSKIGQGFEWRPKIDNQRGLLFATELKHNAFKIAKWTARTILAGADQMKLGYVSRRTKTDSRNHVILGVHHYDPASLSVQVNLTQKNMWGIFKAIVDIVLKQETGKYILLKDPNRQSIILYRVPADEEVEGNDDEDEEDEDDEEEEE